MKYYKCMYIIMILLMSTTVVFSETGEKAASKLDIETSVSVAKDIFNILFFIVVGAIGILSYMQAKKSLFTPIKTETYKYQLEKINSVLIYFHEKNEHELSEKFDISNILHLNSSKMINEFVQAFYPKYLEVQRKINERYRTAYSGSVVTNEYAQRNFYHLTPDNETKIITDAERRHSDSPAITLSNWKKYDHGMVDFTKIFKKETDDLSDLYHSPFLPSKIKELLQKFESVVFVYLEVVRVALIETAQKLPSIYASTEKIPVKDISWIWNEFHSKKSSLNVTLEDMRNEIIKEISIYLKVEEIVD